MSWSPFRQSTPPEASVPESEFTIARTCEWKEGKLAIRWAEGSGYVDVVASNTITDVSSRLSIADTRKLISVLECAIAGASTP